MDWCLDLNQASSAATCDEFSWEKVETGALSHCGTLRIDCATSVRVPLQRELLHSANLGGGLQLAPHLVAGYGAPYPFNGTLISA